MIEAKGVSKHFGGRSVLKDLDFAIRDGEIVALMGPNGAGKTTLLRILSTLIEPSRGEVLLNGKDAYADSVETKKAIGVVGHSTYTYDDLTARENLRFYWLMNGLPAKEFDHSSRDMLARVGLIHRMNDRVSVFSRGMRQRLSIARALIHSPRVLLLDEPFSSLDRKGIEVLTQIIKEERSRGCSVLVVTHDVQRISSLADRADILLGGRITSSFGPDEVKSGKLELGYEASVQGEVM